MPWTAPVCLNAGDYIRKAAVDSWVNDLQHLKDRLDRVYTNVGASTINAGDVCVLQLTSGNDAIVRASSAGQPGPHLIALQTIASGLSGYAAHSGLALVNVTGTVNRGDWLQTSATAGLAQAGRVFPFGQALTAPVSGQVWALLGHQGTELPVTPVVRLGRSAALAIANATLTDITWDSEQEDPANLFTAPGTTITISAAYAGWYIAALYVRWQISPSGLRFARIKTNAGIELAAGSQNATIGLETYQTVTWQGRVSAGTGILCDVFQTSSGAVNLESVSTFTLARLGP